MRNVDTCDRCLAEPPPRRDGTDRTCICVRCALRSSGSTLAPGSRWSHIFITLTLMMVLTLTSAQDESCQTGDLLAGYVPADENTLNKYTPYPVIDTMEDCLAVCCSQATCDMAWMLDGSCFSVQCHSETTCYPGKSSQAADSQLVSVSHHQVRDCIPDLIECDDLESCVASDVRDGYVCQCLPGYTRNLMGACQRDSEGYTVCYQDTDCRDNEFCFGLHLTGYDEGICAPAARFKRKLRETDALRDVETPSTLPPIGAHTSNVHQETPTNTGDLVTPSLVEMPEKKAGGDTGNDTALSEGGTPTNTSDGSHGNQDPHPSASAPSPTPSPHDQSTPPSSSPASTMLYSTSAPSTAAAVGTPAFVQLTVSLGNSKTLQLPDETTIRLNAFVIPSDPPGDQPYNYEYEVVSKPEDSTVEMASTGQTDPTVQFSHLTAGFYQFKVVVTGYRSSGTARVNVTVLAPPRVNQPPVAIIRPAKQVVSLPNLETILDGSGSTDDDDDRIASYTWEQVQGPIGDHGISGDKDTLKLTDLKPGLYLIRLTVTDYDGASNSTIANVTVKEEEDHNPTSNAGPDVEIKLPVNSAILNGSESTDDHGIVTYEWTKMTDKVADMTGSSSSTLHLTNLEEGTYIFRLTVTDKSGQKDTDTATVIVKSEQNLAPTANAGPDKELTLPSDSTELDGSGSTDDRGIVGYQWVQVSGPATAVLAGPDQAQVTVSGLQEGTYIFRLTVTDALGETDSAQVSVSVKGEVKNQAPKAVAGPDQKITLPTSWVELDGTRSTDDKGIESYHWTRSNDSPAAGLVIGGSDHKAVLRVVDLTPGKYKFTLNVTDAKGERGTDTAIVTVVQDPNLLSLVQIIFRKNIEDFTQQDKKDLVMPLAVLLGVNNDDVIIRKIAHTDTSMLKVIFLAFNKTSHQPLPGPEVLKRLKSKEIMSEKMLLNYDVLEYDTIVCQKNCSNHGKCDPYTKRCVCETFWMVSPFRLKFGDGESNCDWSILYVIIISFLLVVVLGILIWLIFCCCSRRKKKGRRRHRYTLLDNKDNEDMEMLHKMGNGKQSSSIMMSESGDDSDDETTVFDIKRQDRNGSKPTNGYVSSKHRSARMPNRTEKLSC